MTGCRMMNVRLKRDGDIRPYGGWTFLHDTRLYVG
jgi:hypothetical protein